MATDSNRPVSTVMAELIDRFDTYTALGTLSLTTALQSGTAVSGWILGATKGSTIASNIPGISVNSALRTYSGTPTGGAQTLAYGLVETLGASPDSPHATSISVAEGAPALAPLLLSSTTARVGIAFTANILNATASSVLSGIMPDGLTLNSAARKITGVPITAGAFTSPLVETLAGATNSPRSTSIAINVAPSITLSALSLSGGLQIGVATSGTILGATTGSTITSNIPGITVNSGLRTYSGTATAAGDGITETLSGALGSPKKSPIAVTAAPQTATIANTNGNSALLGSNVSGFAAPADALDGRLAAAGL